MKRDLHKDRPPPLRIHKPEAAAAPRRPPLQMAPVQYRQPVIIHTYSPEIIQTDSNNFMRLVQRLTGPGSPHTAPPPPKRARVSQPSEEHQISSSTSQIIDPSIQQSTTQGGNSRLRQFALTNSAQRPLPAHPRNAPGLLGASPAGEIVSRQPPPFPGAPELPVNSLLSPSRFDFSPSLLPSPSVMGFDFPSLWTLPSPTLPNNPTPGPLSVPYVLPSPGPLSAGFLADLPVLSPAAYRWIERNPSAADALFSPRSFTASAALPPRPPAYPSLPASGAPGSFQSDDRSGFYKDR